MTLQNFNPDLKIESDSFAWRYMDFEKIWDLLTNNAIYFSRLDTFHDPIEGLVLQDRAALQTFHTLKCELPTEEFSKVYNSSFTKAFQDKIKAWKNGIFCSCWYLTESKPDGPQKSSHHELLAMWNYIKDGEGFVIKIKFQRLLQLIADSLSTLQDDELCQAMYGKVYYLSYGEHSRLLDNTQGNLMPSLIKHNAYSFENELRFLLLRERVLNDNNDRSGIKIKLNQLLSAKEDSIEIIAHPNMSESEFKINREKFLALGFDLKASNILTKQAIDDLLI